MIKKLLMLFIVFILLSNTFSGKICFQNLEIDENATYSFYLLNSVNLNISNVNVIENGNSLIIKTTFKNAKNIRKNLNNILGESVSFKGDKLKFTLIMEKLNLKYSFTENIDNNKIICCFGYSNLNELKNREIQVDEKKVNVQIAFNNNTITIGHPIILGDY